MTAGRWVTGLLAPVLVVVLIGAVGGCTSTETAQPPGGATAGSAQPPRPATGSTGTTGSSGSSAGPPSADRLALALLTVEDLPPGFTQQATSPVEGQVTSTDPRCAPFVATFNARQLPGSQSHAGSRYSGGDLGPFVEEELVALTDAGAVAAAQGQLRSAVAACPRATIDVPGLGQAPVSIEALVPATVGETPVAFRLTVELGTGLSFTQVSAGVGQTVVQLAFLGSEPAQVAEICRVAVDRAATVLG